MTNNTRTQLWARQIKKETGIDVYKNTRAREVVEFRSLIFYLMNKRLKMTLSEIARHFRQNCRPSFNHATVLHSINMFDLYRKYNEELNRLGATLAIDVNKEIEKKRTNVINQVEFIKGMYLDYLENIVQKMYNNTIEDEKNTDSISAH